MHIGTCMSQNADLTPALCLTLGHGNAKFNVTSGFMTTLQIYKIYATSSAI